MGNSKKKFAAMFHVPVSYGITLILLRNFDVPMLWNIGHESIVISTCQIRIPTTNN